MPNPSGVPVDDDDDDSSLSALDSREEIASVNYVDEQTKPAPPKTEEKKEAVKESEPPKAPSKAPTKSEPQKVPTKAPKKPPPMPETEYSEVPDKVNNEIDDAKAKIEADKKNVISLKKEKTPHVKKTLKVRDPVLITAETQILLTSLAPSSHCI